MSEPRVTEVSLAVYCGVTDTATRLLALDLRDTRAQVAALENTLAGKDSVVAWATEHMATLERRSAELEAERDEWKERAETGVGWPYEWQVASALKKERDEARSRSAELEELLDRYAYQDDLDGSTDNDLYREARAVLATQPREGGGGQRGGVEGHAGRTVSSDEPVSPAVVPTDRSDVIGRHEPESSPASSPAQTTSSEEGKAGRDSMEASGARFPDPLPSPVTQPASKEGGGGHGVQGRPCNGA